MRLNDLAWLFIGLVAIVAVFSFSLYQYRVSIDNSEMISLSDVCYEGCDRVMTVCSSNVSVCEIMPHDSLALNKYCLCVSQGRNSTFAFAGYILHIDALAPLCNAGNDLACETIRDYGVDI